MNILQLQYFIELAKNKSFKKTAEANYVTQPAISTQISALEKELGFALFIRNYRDVELTPAGEILFNNLDSSFSSFRNAVNRAKAISEHPDFYILIGVPEYFNLLNMPELIKEFQKQNPNVRVQLESSSLQNLVFNSSAGNHYDLVITQDVMLTHQEELDSRPFTDCRNCLFISSKHPLCSDGKIPSLNELSGEVVFAAADKDTDANTEYVRFVCRTKGLNPGLVKVLPNVNSCLLAAMMCHGIAILDSLTNPPQEYHLERVETDVQVSWLSVWEKANKNPYVPLLARWLQEKIEFTKEPAVSFDDTPVE